MLHSLNDASVLRLVQIALQEDIGMGDITSESIFAAESRAAAGIVAKQAGVVCGMTIAELVFRDLSSSAVWRPQVQDGQFVHAGIHLASVDADCRTLLAGERTALNFLQRMSGVASLARQYADAVEGTACRVLDTRKTIPGWRLLDKYAARLGGVVNHRFGLYDMAMIKDNHIVAAGSIERAIDRVTAENNRADLRIEVETTSLDMVRRVVRHGGAHRIMFDNFPVENIREAVDIVGNSCETEASGGITLSNVRDYAETGVNFVSVGAITHSATALDISMNISVAREYC